MLFQPPLAEIAPSASAVKGVPSVKSVARLAQVTSRLTDAWPAVDHDRCYHFASATMWSTHDLIFRLIDLAGPLAMVGATWSMTAEPCQLLLTGLADGRLLSLDMLFDWRVKVRCPQALALCKVARVNLRVSTCHAKVYCLRNADWKITIVGSANLTNNPRIEAGTVFTTADAWEFHHDWITREIANAKPFGEGIGGYGNRDDH